MHTPVNCTSKCLDPRSGVRSAVAATFGTIKQANKSRVGGAGDQSAAKVVIIFDSRMKGGIIIKMTCDDNPKKV